MAFLEWMRDKDKKIAFTIAVFLFHTKQVDGVNENNYSDQQWKQRRDKQLGYSDHNDFVNGSMWRNYRLIAFNSTI